jgi:hypothetical protein
VSECTWTLHSSGTLKTPFRAQINNPFLDR